LKKLIALILLAVFLFNIGGYLAIHEYLEYKTDHFFTEQTRKGLYNSNDLTEVKLPANLPGITDWKHYENISGQVQFGNTSYNYVKMKITRNAIYLMCIPNYKTTRLTDKNIIQAKNMAGTKVPQKQHIPYGKGTLKDDSNITLLQFAIIIQVRTLAKPVLQPVLQLVHPHLDIPEQPPKFSC
jgi:hypothetical protein